MVKDSDGNAVRIGDEVEFKRDVEMSGTVLKIRGNSILVQGPDEEYSAPQEFWLETPYDNFWKV